MIRSKKEQAGGFSLVEIVIALAIIATVGVTIIGVIPSGFENVRKAVDLSVVSRILQSISSDAQASEWNDYADRFSGSGELYLYYDDQGNGLQTSGGINHIYTALVELEKSGTNEANSAGIELPGEVGKPRVDRSSDLRKLVIRVTTIPGEDGIAALQQSGSRSDYSEHSLIISNFKAEEVNDAP